MEHRVIIGAVIGLLVIAVLLRSIIKHHQHPGNAGEARVARYLKPLTRHHYYVLNNVMLKRGDDSVQMDHIVIGRSGIFVIETKNYHGSVSGNENAYKWSHHIGGNHFTFYNPCRQNATHIRVLKSYLRSFGELPFYSIIAFPKECHVEADTEETVVIPWNHLRRTIRSHFLERALSDADARAIYEELKRENADTWRNRRLHVRTVNQKAKRSDGYLQRGRCPKCGSRLRKVYTFHGSYYKCKNRACHYTQSRKRIDVH